MPPAKSVCRPCWSRAAQDTAECPGGPRILAAGQLAQAVIGCLAGRAEVEHVAAQQPPRARLRQHGRFGAVGDRREQPELVHPQPGTVGLAVDTTDDPRLTRLNSRGLRGTIQIFLPIVADQDRRIARRLVQNGHDTHTVTRIPPSNARHLVPDANFPVHSRGVAQESPRRPADRYGRGNPAPGRVALTCATRLGGLSAIHNQSCRNSLAQPERTPRAPALLNEVFVIRLV